MKKIYSLKYLILTLVVIATLSGCASTTYSKRYNKTIVASKKQETKNTRYFASDTVKQVTKPISNPSEISFLNEEDDASIDEIDDESENLPVTEEKIDLNAFKAKFRLSDKYNLALTKKEKLLFQIITYLETPYSFGSNSLKGTDCSGFTKNALEKLNIQLPRSAREQYREGDTVNKTELQFGDLVFFNTRRRAFPGHVGIYLGDDQFVHASTKKGVIVSSMLEDYYKKRYVGARRVTTFDETNN